MEPNYTLKDYGAFVKQNLKTIILVTLLTLAGFIGFSIFSGRPESTPDPRNDNQSNEFNMEEIEQYMETDYQLLNDNQKATLVAYLNQDAYYFRYYVETNESLPYSHFRTIKEFLTTEEISDYIEEVTNTELKPDSKRAIRLAYDNSANLHTFTVGVGNKDDNREIANAYYELIQSGEIPLFENKKVHFIDDEPLLLVDELEGAQVEDVDPVEPAQNRGTTVILGIIVTIGGVLLGTIVAYVVSIMNKKISYLYNYAIPPKDTVIKIRETDQKKIEQKNSFVLKNIEANSLFLLVQDDEDILSLGQLKTDLLDTGKQITIASDLVNATDVGDYEQIIIYTKVNSTTKEWYKTQRNLTDIKQKPIMIIETRPKDEK